MATWFDVGYDATPYDPVREDDEREVVYDDGDLPERSGPIIFDYDECILWRWADQDGVHVGRSWSGHALEDDRPCPKAACGLVVGATVDHGCPQHALEAAKTIRQQHTAELCPQCRRGVSMTAASGVRLGGLSRTLVLVDDLPIAGRIKGDRFQPRPGFTDVPLSAENLRAIADLLDGLTPTTPNQDQDQP